MGRWCVTDENVDEREALIKIVAGHEASDNGWVYAAGIVAGGALLFLIGLIFDPREMDSWIKWVLIVAYVGMFIGASIVVQRAAVWHWVERPLHGLTLEELKARLPEPKRISGSVAIAQSQISELGVNVARRDLEEVKRRYPTFFRDVVTAYVVAYKTGKTRATLPAFADEYFAGVPEESL